MGVSGAGDGGGDANVFFLHVEGLDDEDEPPCWIVWIIVLLSPLLLNPEVLDLHEDGYGAWLPPSNVKYPSTSE